VIFSVITGGIYSAAWFLTRRRGLNVLSSDKKISVAPFVICIVLLSMNLLTAFLSGAAQGTGEFETERTLDGVSAILRLAAGITLLVQAFKVRSMLSEHFATAISGVGTFFFNVWYLQHKINQLTATQQSVGKMTA
jgi:hypothetical protein